jgi:predicted O-methyltransferase YrrM
MTTLFSLKNINFETFNDILDNFNPDERGEFIDEPGKQHYKLLAHYSCLFNNSVIIDIGTHHGKSALALSYNKTNTVISFDIVDTIENQKLKTRDNIEFYLENLWQEEVRNKWTETILNAPFIFLDVDPHNGTMEYDFYLFLRSIDYGGILICDDIWYFKEMRDNFWYKIPDKYRHDVTEYGHWSGTGIIDFQKGNTPVNIPRQPSCDNWTLVTAYFDLTKTPDASPDIKARDQNYYLNTYGTSTLHLPYNLVIYCDVESRDKIAKIRPDYLKDRTHYVICNFEDFQMEVNGKTFTDFREQIKENR